MLAATVAVDRQLGVTRVTHRAVSERIGSTAAGSSAASRLTVT
jgi:hypothetical protein